MLKQLQQTSSFHPPEPSRSARSAPQHRCSGPPRSMLSVKCCLASSIDRMETSELAKKQTSRHELCDRSHVSWIVWRLAIRTGSALLDKLYIATSLCHLHKFGVLLKQIVMVFESASHQSKSQQNDLVTTHSIQLGKTGCSKL